MKVNFRLLEYKNQYWVPITDQTPISPLPAEIKKTVSDTLNKIGWNPAWNLVVGIGDNEELFFEKKIYYDLSNSYGQQSSRPIRPISNPFVQELKSTVHPYEPAPLLLITPSSLEAVREKWEVEAKEAGAKGVADKEVEQKSRKAHFRHILSFWDHSIWHYYVHFDDDPELAEKMLVDRLKKIQHNHEQELYKTYIAKEILESTSRQLLNAYILNLKSGHALQISQVFFHSQTEKEVENEKLLIETEGLKLGCLLIDDYAFEGLRKGRNDQISLTKLMLLEQLMGDQIQILNRDDRPTETETWVDYARRMAVETYPQYDLILLDYNLGPQQPNAVHFLQHLCQQAPDYRLGKKKHLVFSISSFGIAFRDDIQRSLPSESFLDFRMGADPVLNPTFFKHKILHLMAHRQEKFARRIEDKLSFTLQPLQNHKQLFEINQYRTVEGLAMIRGAVSEVKRRIALQIDHLEKVAYWKDHEHLLVPHDRPPVSKLTQTLINKHYPADRFPRKRQEDYHSFFLKLHQILEEIAYGTGGNWWKMSRDLLELRRLINYQLKPRSDSAKKVLTELKAGLLTSLESLVQHFQS